MSRPRFARRVRGHRALTLAFAPRLIIQLSGGCQISSSTNRAPPQVESLLTTILLLHDRHFVFAVRRRSLLSTCMYRALPPTKVSSTCTSCHSRRLHQGAVLRLFCESDAVWSQCFDLVPWNEVGHSVNNVLAHHVGDKTGIVTTSRRTDDID